MKIAFFTSAYILLSTTVTAQFNLTAANENNINIKRQTQVSQNINSTSRNAVRQNYTVTNIDILSNNFNQRSNTNKQNKVQIRSDYNNPVQQASRTQNPVITNRNNVNTIPNNRNTNVVNKNNQNQIPNTDHQIQNRSIQKQNQIVFVNQIQSENNSENIGITKNVNDFNLNESGNIIHSDNNEQIQLQTIDLNIKLEIPPVQTQFKIKPVTAKLSVSLPEISMDNNINNSEKIKEEKVKISKTINTNSKIEKHKGGSSYSQNKGKNYTAKKIKIWFKKNFKAAKKIRLKVSCPKF